MAQRKAEQDTEQQAQDNAAEVAKVVDDARERPEEGYRDVSAEVEQAEKDAQEPVDPETGDLRLTSPAAAAVQEERNYRAGAQANGGGPWPPEVLVQQWVGATTVERSIPEYTSHEVEHKDA